MTAPPGAPGHAERYFPSGDEEELHKEDHRDNIRQHGDVLALARAELEHGVADQAQADAVADGAGDRHGDEHDGHRQALINVVKVDLLEAAEHEQADVDERGARRGGGDDGGNGREEHAREEEHAGHSSVAKLPSKIRFFSFLFSFIVNLIINRLHHCNIIFDQIKTERLNHIEEINNK